MRPSILHLSLCNTATDAHPPAIGHAPTHGAEQHTCTSWLQVPPQATEPQLRPPTLCPRPWPSHTPVQGSRPQQRPVQWGTRG